jgi:hypothetical protein
MKEQDIKHIEAFNDFFGKSIRSEYSTVRNERGDYHVMNTSPFDNKIIRCHFKKFAYPVTIAETIYKNNCSFHLTNMSDVDVSYIFRDNDYNYDVVEKVINALFKLGQEFSFYTEMSPIQNIKLENNFNKNGIQKAVIVPTVTKLTLSSILADKSASGKPTKKTAIVHLAFMVSDDNQLHPVLELAIPYSVSKFTRFLIHLHPSKRDEQIKHIPVILKEFENLLITHLDFVLTKFLKIKKNELDTMTLEDKKNYLPVIEMSRI